MFPTNNQELLNNISIDIIHNLGNQLQKPHYSQLLTTLILQPVIKQIFKELYPYILITSIIFVLTFLLSFSIFLILLFG